MTRTANVRIRKEPYYRRAAIETGLRKLGYVLTGEREPRDRESLLVLWNKKRGLEEDWADEWEAKGGTVIVVENGYLQKVDKTHYAISVHGHNGSGWFPVGSEDRFTRLGFELKDWHEGAGHVLVCGQRGIGSRLMHSPALWAEKIAEKLRQQQVSVRLRLHPGNHAPKVPLLDDLAGATEVWIWSSGAGVRALVEGYRVKHHAPHWICDRPANRVDQLQRMSHGQWHHDEIATGEPFARILASLEKATW